MDNKFLRWVSFSSGWVLVPEIDNKKCGVFESVKAPNGKILVLSEIVKDDFYFSLLLQFAIEHIQETIFSSESIDRKIYRILFNFDHKNRKWDASVFLNGDEVAATSPKKCISNIKLLVLKFIYQFETGE